ncbi:MAG: hypothetical protein ACN4GW_10810 [Desulforhopalus sp.]
MSEAAVEFLKQHGNRSLISLGCGNFLNRLDNHVRLFVQCELDYYVAIDRVTQVDFNPESAFADSDAVNSLLSSYFDGRPELFYDRVRTFPDTYVEEFQDVQCQVVVCQRVLPFRHWEEVIKSMNPILVLQEDLKGCELQALSGELYKKSFPGIIHYHLQPFRPNRFMRGERNIILWRRRDFFPCCYDKEPWWKRLRFRLSRNKSRMLQNQM